MAAPAGLASAPRVRGTPLPRAAVLPGAVFALSLRGGIGFIFSEAKRVSGSACFRGRGDTASLPRLKPAGLRGRGGQLRRVSAKLFPGQRWWRRREGAGAAAGCGRNGSGGRAGMCPGSGSPAVPGAWGGHGRDRDGSAFGFGCQVLRVSCLTFIKLLS